MTYRTHAAAASPEPAPEAYLMQISFGAMISQALYVAAKLGIADLVADKPQAVGALALVTGTHERALYRVLRSLAGVGIFEEIEPKVFAITPNAQPLRSGVPNSFRNGAIFVGEEWHWRVWGNMLHSVRTGEPAWSSVQGAAVFEYLATRPEEAAIFNSAMTEMSANIAPVIVDAYDFSGFRTLADIAGGHGYLLAHILKSNPGLSGVLFDAPQVIAGAGELLERQGVAARVEKVSGDFFAAVPAGADAYIMKHIIHDWDDERALTILKNIAAAMPDHGRVLIVEMVVPDGNGPHESKVLDLEMLVSPGGVERTAAEYGTLLGAAGLRLTRIVPTASPYSIVESVKAE